MANNISQLQKFFELQKKNRNCALDVNTEMGEVVCRFSRSRSSLWDHSAGRDLDGVGEPGEPYTDKWMRVAEHKTVDPSTHAGKVIAALEFAEYYLAGHEDRPAIVDEALAIMGRMSQAKEVPDNDKEVFAALDQAMIDDNSAFKAQFDEYLRYGLYREKDRGAMKLGWDLHASGPPYKDCCGIPDSRCSYTATCKQICNKCGNVHNGHEHTKLPNGVALHVVMRSRGCLRLADVHRCPPVGAKGVHGCGDVGRGDVPPAGEAGMKLIDACEQIDDHLFTGELLNDSEMVLELEAYMLRWAKEIHDVRSMRSSVDLAQVDPTPDTAPTPDDICPVPEFPSIRTACTHDNNVYDPMRNLCTCVVCGYKR